MALFFLTCKNPDVIKKSFYDIAMKGIKEGYTININAWAWQYKQRGNSFFIWYRLTPSFTIINWFLYILYKIALRIRYKEKCEYIGVSKGIRLFLDME